MTGPAWLLLVGSVLGSSVLGGVVVAYANRDKTKAEAGDLIAQSWERVIGRLEGIITRLEAEKREEEARADEATARIRELESEIRVLREEVARLRIVMVAAGLNPDG